MNDGIKFETIYGTWILGTDVENPDELVDPGDFYDWLSSFDMSDKIELGLATQDQIDEYEECVNDDDDDDDFF